MKRSKNSPCGSLSPNDLVKNARDLASYAAKTGNQELTDMARDFEKRITDYVFQRERKASVLRAFGALSELLSDPEFKKIVYIEFIVKLMVEIFMFLVHNHV